MKRIGFLEKFRGKSSEEDDDLNSLPSHAQDMVKGVKNLSQMTVRDILLPRIDAVFIAVSYTHLRAHET